MGVVVGDEVINVFPELGDRGERGAAQRLAGEDGEEDLDLIEPGSLVDVKWKLTLGCAASQSSFFSWVLRLSTTAWIFWSDKRRRSSP
jgi:hypothetical protein